jgi:hypothetical protein
MNDNIELSKTMLALVPVVAWLIQQVKEIPALSFLKQWLSYISVVAGVGMACLVNWNFSPQETIIPGIIMGILATGGYEMMKTKNGQAKPSEPK